MLHKIGLEDTQQGQARLALIEARHAGGQQFVQAAPAQTASHKPVAPAFKP